MRSRQDLLSDLISLQGDIKEIERDLSSYPWDTEKPLLSVSKSIFISVLKRCISGTIDFDTIISCANMIECRDDLEFENEEVQEIVFELANPEINGEITVERLQEIVRSLE